MKTIIAIIIIFLSGCGKESQSNQVQSNSEIVGGTGLNPIPTTNEYSGTWSDSSLSLQMKSFEMSSQFLGSFTTNSYLYNGNFTATPLTNGFLLTFQASGELTNASYTITMSDSVMVACTTIGNVCHYLIHS